MPKNNLSKKALFQRELIAYFLLTVGSLLFAVGDVMFVNPYLMAPGGTYGLSNVFNTLWPWKISLYAICMDIPLLIIGTWILGPKFGVKTIVSTALIFAFTFVLESWWGYNPVIHGGDIVAKQAMGALCLNRSFLLPPCFCLMETANDPGEAVALPGIRDRAAAFAARISRELLP